MAKVSIIIPVYNVEKYLNQCLDSIRNQTFKDFECICVNDGSTDNSLKILQSYADKDNRFKVVSKKSIGGGNGVSAARNIGIKNATSEYITFIDADDWVDLKYLEVLYNTITKYDLDIVISKSFFYFERKKIFAENTFIPNIKINKNTGVYDKFFYGYPWGTVWGIIYKTNFIKYNNLLFLEGVITEDYLFIVLAFMITNKILLIDNKLYYYRREINSITSNVDNLTISKFINNFWLIKELRNRNIYTCEIENYLVKSFFHNMADVYKRAVNSKYNINYLYDKCLDNLYFLNTIKKDLKMKYRLLIPIIIKLFLYLKIKIFTLRRIFKFIY